MIRKLFRWSLGSFGIIAFLASLVVAFSTQINSHISSEKEWDLTISWIVSPAQAHLIMNNGGILLDARGMVHRFIPSVSEAKTISWSDFSVANSHSQGNLTSKTEIEKRLHGYNMNADSIIIVLGDPLHGWGEEGRIVWMLRSIGYHYSYWVDGGARAFKDQSLKGFPEINGMIDKKKATKSRSLNIDTDVLRKDIFSIDLTMTVLDVREEREFIGETPYGESRGGHIPGAKWFFFRDFVDSDGYLKSKLEIEKLIQSKHIPPKTTFVSYCTGGVRSAWTTSVFLSYGFKAKNYSGSMWEWASQDPIKYPLVQGKN